MEYDAYDVSTSLTGYEPNFMAFSELNDSSGSFSYINPSSDQDVDDVTLGEMLTAAHRGQADFCEPEGVSVSQSSSSVVFDGSGKPEELNSSNAQIRTLLEEQRQMIIAEYCRENWSSRTPSSSCRKRAPNSTRRIMATAIGIS